MKKENTVHVVLLIISLLTLIGLAFQFFAIKNYVHQEIEKSEAIKVGGIENYETLKSLYESEGFKSAQKQQIANALAQMNGQQPAAQEQGDTAGQFPTGKLTPDQLAAVKKDAYVAGNKDAKVTIVEYSDPECPFCIRHHNDKTISTVMASFEGNVNHILKVVQGVNHPGTEYKSLAILCAGKLGGEKAYYGLFDAILGGSTPESPIATTQVPGLATTLGLNQKNFTSCVDTKELAAAYAANWKEAVGFNSTGTPGNLIINNETGEWTLIAGAYPAATFTQVIAPWLQ